MANFKKMLCLALVAGSASLSWAQTGSTDSSMFRFSGFGTLGISHSDSSESDFSSTVFHPNGAGYTRSWSMDVDTKLGFQINADFTKDLSGVVQIISQQGYNNAYTPGIEWANVSYKLTPNLTVRGGRTVWPLLLRSETQSIGYGNPFVRNSTELLANMPNTYSDGLDVTYQFPIGPAASSIQLLYGKSDVMYPGAGPTMGQNYLNLKDIKGISSVTEYGDLKVHMAYMDLKYDWLYFDYPLADVGYKTWSVGFNYDPGGWFVTADYLKALDVSYGNFTALTAGAGYRFGDWTPYVLYSSLTQDALGKDASGQVISYGVDPGDQQIVKAIGLRWDFKKNADFKIQYEQVTQKYSLSNCTPSYPYCTMSQIFPSSLTNWTPGFISNPTANVLSLVVNFVF